MNIEHVTVTLMIDGKGHILSLSQDKLMILMGLAQGLSDNGALNVRPLPKGVTAEVTRLSDLAKRTN